jgi:hypothetical protein
MERIPKELHLYWDGSNMSRLQSLTVESFHKLNPDWDINIYMPHTKYTGDMRFDFIPDYIGPDYFHKIAAQDYVNVFTIDLNDYGIQEDLPDILRSDIFRYHVLYHVGGVWSDFDVLWLRPMDHFHNIEYYGGVPINKVNAVVSFYGGTCGGHSIGIMIHAKGDSYVKSLIQFSKEVLPPFSHEVFGGSMLNQHYPTLESIPHKNVIGVKFETYYPYNIHPPNPTIQELYENNNIRCLQDNNVMCLHWYNGHSMSKGYVNGNGFERDCSMTTVLRECGYI